MPQGRVKKVETIQEVEPVEEAKSLPTSLPKWAYPALVGFLALVVVGLYLWNNKGLILAATVNNKPIWKWEVLMRLNDKYGATAIDEMANEKLITDTAAGKNLFVSGAEVEDKIKEIEKSLEGKIALKDALTQQGLSDAEFRKQVGLQILVEKLTADKAFVSDKEIEDYLAKNKALMIATEAAKQREEAKNALIAQARSSAFQGLFSQLKKDAKIVKF